MQAGLNYLSAAVLALLALLVVLKERQAGSVSLGCGALLLAFVQLFDQVALSDPERLYAIKRVVLSGKALVPMAFLSYGLSHRKGGSGGTPRMAFHVLALLGVAFAASPLVVPLGHLFSMQDGAGEQIIALGQVGYWFSVGLMILCVAALANLEAVFSSIRGGDRWRVKYEFLGVGSALGVYIYYFSQGLLYHSVNMSLLPVQSAVLTVAALLIGYSRLFRRRGPRVVVSRRVIYRSFTLAAVGLYLLALGVFGQVVRHLDIPFDLSLVYFVAFLGGILFLILLFSEEIRRRVAISTARHFFAAKHDYRERWLELSKALADCRTLAEVQDVVLDALRGTFGLRSVALYLRDPAGHAFLRAAAQGGGDWPPGLRVSAGMLGYFTETGRVLDPADGDYTPVPAEAEFLRATGAWLLVPLLAGERLEAVVVFGRQVVPEQLSYEDFDLMKLIGRQAVLSLANFRLSEELAEAREMAAVAKVSSFVIHDLKNLAYTFSLMMENADANIGDPAFQGDLVRSIRATVAKMNGLIAKLKALPGKAELHLEGTDLAALARETVAELESLRPAVRFEASFEPAAVRADALELRKVILNLLLNACDAVRPQGKVTVRTGTGAGEALLTVEDDGAGMSAAFIERHLFRPFRTTKEKGLGIGLYQCRQIVEAHGGRIEASSREGRGSVFTVALPGQGAV